MKEGELFEDDSFPADASSLFFSRRSKEELAQYTWRRPHQLAERPDIYVDGTSRKDVIQGGGEIHDIPLDQFECKFSVTRLLRRELHDSLQLTQPLR